MSSSRAHDQKSSPSAGPNGSSGPERDQDSEYLTTAQRLRLPDTEATHHVLLDPTSRPSRNASSRSSPTSAKLGAAVLVIAPAGGVLSHGARKETVERTLLTARSVEFDAVVVAGGTTPTGDIKLVLLLQEAFRHAKARGAWGDGAKVLAAAGIPADSAGVVTGTPWLNLLPTNWSRRWACTGPGTARRP